MRSLLQSVGMCAVPCLDRCITRLFKYLCQIARYKYEDVDAMRADHWITSLFPELKGSVVGLILLATSRR